MLHFFSPFHIAKGKRGCEHFKTLSSPQGKTLKWSELELISTSVPRAKCLTQNNEAISHPRLVTCRWEFPERSLGLETMTNFWLCMFLVFLVFWLLVFWLKHVAEINEGVTDGNNIYFVRIESTLETRHLIWLNLLTLTFTILSHGWGWHFRRRSSCLW